MAKQIITIKILERRKIQLKRWFYNKWNIKHHLFWAGHYKGEDVDEMIYEAREIQAKIDELDSLIEFIRRKKQDFKNGRV